MKEKNSQKIITLSIALAFVIIFAVTKLLPYLSTHEKDTTQKTADNQTQSYYDEGTAVRLKQYGSAEVYPLEVTLQNAVYEETLSDNDGYYEERGIISQKLENLRNAYGGSLFYQSDYRYIVVDLKIKRPKLTDKENALLDGDVVYEFQSLALNNQMDDGKIGITSAALNATDYRILEGDEDSYSIVPSKLNEGQSVLTLSEDAEVTMQLVYMIPFGEESILYQPCLNLTTHDPNSGEVGSGTYVFFDYAAVSLDLNRYESEYPLNVSESSAQSAKADVTIQSRDAAEGKAEDGLLNYEIAGLETENGLSVADERLSSGDIIYDGLFGYDGNINQSDTYTAFENVTGRLYDTMSELPQYFADSNALKKICERYTEQGGYAEENLKFLTVQFEYTYYAERTDGLTIHNLQKIWLYDQKEDGLFYPYGYPDDYQILSAQTDGNTEHSPYLYLKNGESAVVEVVYVISADSYQKLYVTPADRLLWQESVDGLCTTFSCVLAKDTEF